MQPLRGCGKPVADRFLQSWNRQRGSEASQNHNQKLETTKWSMRFSRPHTYGVRRSSLPHSYAKRCSPRTARPESVARQRLERTSEIYSPRDGRDFRPAAFSKTLICWIAMLFSLTNLSRCGIPS
ncbi:MAG: hypothetical protein IKN99_00790 [Bacteroidales bacterium]|nr:hypothetical protein [Bacteroidales bacterium]